MKLLFLTVALVHCAFAAQEQKHAQEELGGLDEEDPINITIIAECPHCDGTGNVEKESDESEEPCVPCKGTGEDENAKFELSPKAARMSDLIKNIIEGDKLAGIKYCVCPACKKEYTIGQDTCPTCIIPNSGGVQQTLNVVDGKIVIKKVEGPILQLIAKYLQYHNGKVPTEIAKPIRSTKMDVLVEDDWDATFINEQSKKVIFQIILGANYMHITSLLHLGCAKIATLIKGKSPEEIKKILGDDEDVTVDGGKTDPGVGKVDPDLPEA